MSKNALSIQQEKIVPLVAQGLTDQEIADQLSLTKNSVSQSIKEIFQKFAFRNRVQLVLWHFNLLPSEPVSYITKVQHKYQAGDKVRVTNHAFKGAEGEIVARMPWMLVFPGYDVRIDGVVVAVSERSLTPIDENGLVSH